MPRALAVFGTRPEAIKLAPVLKSLAEAPGWASVVCITAQHREMLDQVMGLFDIRPDYDLEIMHAEQDLFDVTARALLGLRDVLRSVAPDVVLVQGDTTTCLAGAMAGFYEKVPVAHVEAGLRTGDLRAPFPEEGNRSLVGRLATYHFAPTEGARANLRMEGIDDSVIWVTGNTVIDALLWVRGMVSTISPSVWVDALGGELIERVLSEDRRLVLVTGHRRENFGSGLRNACSALRELALRHADWDIVYPVHLNPNVQEPVRSALGGIENIFLPGPLEYAPFVWLMDRSTLILTDSGGIQEEAPSLGKPVLVMRDVTERPEAVSAGAVRLVGTDAENLIEATEEVMLNDRVRGRMARAGNPFGDGHAAQRIVETLSFVFRR